MSKGKSTWKYNKLLTARRNYYVAGTSNLRRAVSPPPISPDVAGYGGEAVPNNPVNSTTDNSEKSGNGVGIQNVLAGIQGVANMAAGILGSGTDVAKMPSTDTPAPIGGANDSFDQLATDWSNYTDQRLTTSHDFYKKSALDEVASGLNAGIQGFSAGMQMGGPWAGAAMATVGTGGSILSSLLHRRKARKLSAAANREIRYNNDFNKRALVNRAGNLMEEQLDLLDTSYFSHGGVMNRKKSFGGELHTNGGAFTNGLLYIDNGGSHETNPYEGVPLGVDPEGTPNLVEEGETVFNDYVFSKRLSVPKAIRDKYKLRSTKEFSFAEMSKELAKESEERPNDPISKRGLEALMADLANAQEGVRETQQVRQHAMGGRLFKTGGNKGNQTLNYNNKTEGLYFGLDKSQFNPYASDGTIDWNIMYGADSPYTKRRQYVIDHWDDPGVQEWLGRYVEGINEYNKGRDGYQPMTKSDITKDIFTNRTWDKSWGGMHAGVDYAGDPAKKIIEQHMLRSLEGDPTAMPETDIYYPSTRGGYTWADRFSDKYTRANNGAYEETTDDDGNTVRTYYYDPVEAKKPTNRYYKKNSNGQYELVTGDNPYLTIQNAGKYNQVRSAANDQDGTDYYYDPEEADPEYKELPTELRYAPAVGLGIAAITDALGLTNKPNYGGAEAILEASRGAGTYQPVRFNPIGNYLTYKPFDRQYYLNQLNAQSGATRRSILNTSAGNRGTAIAGLLAADNNYLNQIGNLARQAEEYNLAQKSQVEEFNRGTNMTNSQGFLQADIANQKALMNSREFSLKGTMAAAEMRERSRLASEQAKSANLSGLITSLGDIGKENMAWNWRNFGLATGSFGNVGDEQYLLTHTGKKKSNKGAKGGKIKRRKGLTI